MARTFELTTTLGTDVLLFHRMSVTEDLGRLGDYRLDMLSERGDVNLDKILGQRVTIKMKCRMAKRATSPPTSLASLRLECMGGTMSTAPC